MQADYIIGTNAELPTADISDLTSDEFAELLAGTDEERLSDKLIRLKPHENYTWDDKGVAQIFATVYINASRYNVTAKSWYTYDGTRWVMDIGDMRVLQKAKLFADALIGYAASIRDERQRTDYMKLALKYGQLRGRETLVKDARDVHFITAGNLDANPDLFNCQNGTLNLRTGIFSPHSPRDMLSKISNVHYDPCAKSTTFDSFINEVMQQNEPKTDYLQRVLGLSLTTDTSAESCWFLYGRTTRNGKSTLVETIAHMMGDYACTMPPQTLAQRKDKDTRTASGDIARLEGCRFLNASEPPKRMLFDAALLKTLLGRDTIVARHLYEREREFVPVFKLFINTNYLPLITDDTLFTSGRINVITFDRHFEPHEQDRTLKTRLASQENIAGIFNWCLEGLRKFRRSGAEPPECVIHATKEYRDFSDKIGLFMNECMEKTGGNSAAGKVYERFREWCIECGFGVSSKPNFFDEMRGKNLFVNSATIEGKTVRNVIVGYELVEWTEVSSPVPF